MAAADAAPTRTVDFSVDLDLRQGLAFRVNGENHGHDHPVMVGTTTPG